jgi:hypothetical protein
VGSCVVGGGSERWLRRGRGTGEVDRWDPPRGGDAAATGTGGLAAKEIGVGLVSLGWVVVMWWIVEGGKVATKKSWSTWREDTGRGGEGEAGERNLPELSGAVVVGGSVSMHEEKCVRKTDPGGAAASSFVCWM